MIAFWPAIMVRSAAALSTFLRSLTPSPMPMLSTIFVITGTCIGFLYPNCSVSLPRMALSNSTRRRGWGCLSAIDFHSRTLGDTHLASIVHDLEADARRLAGFRVGERDIGQM